MHPRLDQRQPGMWPRFESNRRLGTAGGQGHRNAPRLEAAHQLRRAGHRLGVDQQRFGNRLAHRKQLIPAGGGESAGVDPLQDLLRAVQPAPAPQGQQFLRRERSSEPAGGLLPGRGVQRLGVEQQPVEIEEAGSRQTHRTILQRPLVRHV